MKIARFEFNPFGVNTYVVWNPSSMEAAIVDPGMENRDECEAIEAFISSTGLKVTHLINTHLHVDHILGDRWVERTYGVELEAHPDDAFLGEEAAAQARMFHMPVSLEAVKIGHELSEGDKIALGNDHLDVLHVPGHSPGSIVLYNDHDSFVIVGDVLFRGSIGRTDLAGGNHGLLVEGIHDKLMTLPESTVVFPGHGPQTTIGVEMRSNPFLR